MHKDKVMDTVKETTTEVKKMKDVILTAHKDVYYTAAAMLYNACREADIEFAKKEDIHELLVAESRGKHKNIYIVGVRVMPENAVETAAALDKLEAAGKKVKWYLLEDRVQPDIDPAAMKTIQKYIMPVKKGQTMIEVIKENEPVIVEDFTYLKEVYESLDVVEVVKAGFTTKVSSDKERHPVGEYVVYRWDQHFTLRDDPEGDRLKEMIRTIAFQGKLSKEAIDEAGKYNFIYVDMVFKSKKMADVMSKAKKIGDRIRGGHNKVAVLLTGETGSGKDVIARQIHRFGGRSTYRAINCAAIPKDMIESELFGHRKGSFTGAINNKVGIFELADGGTLFLDEITEIPVESQAKLLRAIETLMIHPMGSEEEDKEVDVMIIAATNKDIKKEIQAKKFRMDLYQRLSTIEIMVPPLRERPEDLKIMTEHFMLKKAKAGYPRRIMKKDEIKLMENYWWPGNVRQLEKFLERVLMLEDASCTFKDILEDMKKGDEYLMDEAKDVTVDRQLSGSEKVLTLDEGEKILITRALRQHDDNIEETRKALGLGSRNTLLAKIQKYGIAVKE